MTAHMKLELLVMDKVFINPTTQLLSRKALLRPRRDMGIAGIQACLNQDRQRMGCQNWVYHM